MKKPFNRPKPKKLNKDAPTDESMIRLRLPRDREVFGLVEQRLGGSRMRVRCYDNVTRICRIPGRLKRTLWVREADTVLVEPWELSTEKGDIVYKYKINQVEMLKKKGHLKDITEFDDNF